MTAGTGSEARQADRGRARTALHAAGDEPYRLLVEHIQLGISIIDAQHRIVMINPAQARMFRKAPQDFMGRMCFAEFEKRDSVCPHCPGVRAMADGLPHEVETDGVRDDGSRLTARVHAFPLPAPGGGARGFIEVVEDITERVRAEQALRDSEARYGSLVDNVLVGVALIGPGMHVLAANSQLRKWFPNVDAREKPFCYRVCNTPPREDPCPDCPAVKAFADGEVHEHTREVVTAEGTKHFRTAASPVKDASGKVVAVTEMKEDVTEVVRARRELEERAAQLAGANEVLEREIAERKRVETQLRKSLGELKQFNRLAVGREVRMIELKREVNEMAHRARLTPPYDVAFAEAEEAPPGAGRASPGPDAAAGGER